MYITNESKSYSYYSNIRVLSIDNCNLVDLFVC